MATTPELLRQAPLRLVLGEGPLEVSDWTTEFRLPDRNLADEGAGFKEWPPPTVGPGLKPDALPQLHVGGIASAFQAQQPDVGDAAETGLDGSHLHHYPSETPREPFDRLPTNLRPLPSHQQGRRVVVRETAPRNEHNN